MESYEFVDKNVVSDLARRSKIFLTDDECSMYVNDLNDIISFCKILLDEDYDCPELNIDFCIKEENRIDEEDEHKKD